jgi:hypothetical protein
MIINVEIFIVTDFADILHPRRLDIYHFSGNQWTFPAAKSFIGFD